MKFTFAYTGIRVRDLDRSIDFYTRVLGMNLEGRQGFEETRGKIAGAQSEGTKHPLEINWYAEDSPVADPYGPGEELDHLAFAVEDLDAALDYLEKEGHPKVLGPIEGTNSRWAFVKDPDGIWIELFAPRD